MAFTLSNLTITEKFVFAGGLCIGVLVVMLRFGSMAAMWYLHHMR